MLDSDDGTNGTSQPTSHGISNDGEHPWVTLREVCSRPHPHGHVITFANEKGGVGKSTLAFHCAVALAHAGHDVLAIDLDRRQHSLDTAFTNRDATARSLQVDLPRPRHLVLDKPCGAQLNQEITRIGAKASIIILDVAGHDSRIARYAMAMADTLITPMNSSGVDLDLLGKFDPVNHRLKQPGAFAQLVCGLQHERRERGMKELDWVVMKNRVRTTERRQQERIDDALAQLATSIGFRMGEGFRERVAYRELFAFGLTHLDLRYIPGLARLQASTGDEIHRLVEDLNLPATDGAPQRQPAVKPRLSRRASHAYRSSLDAHFQPRPSSLESTG